MAEPQPAPSVPTCVQELQQILVCLADPDCEILRAYLADPVCRAWCVSFRFKDKYGFDWLEPNIPASGTLLHYDDVAVASMRLLVKAGVPVDETDDEGFTPLYITVMNLFTDKREETIFTLLELGSDPEKLVTDAAGWTILHHAVLQSGGETATVKRLLDCGCALIDHQGEDGDTAMQWSSPQTLSLLLEYGANMSLTNIRGEDVMECLHSLRDSSGEDAADLRAMDAIWIAEKHRR